MTCINKTDRYDPHERISHLGGDGWRLTQSEAIDQVKADPDAFYVSEGGSTVRVILATHSGREYLKTVADGEQPDNLLALPECS